MAPSKERELPRWHALISSVLPQQRLLDEPERAAAGHVVVGNGPRRRAAASQVQEQVREVEQRVVRVGLGVLLRGRRRRGRGRRRGAGAGVVGAAALGALGIACAFTGAGARRRQRREVGGGGERGRGLHVLGRRGGRAREQVRLGREVEVRVAGALDGERRHVVRARRHLRGGEGAQPDAGLLAGLPDLRHPLAPAPHAHAAVRRVTAAVLARPLLRAHGGRRGRGGGGGGRGRGGRGGRLLSVVHVHGGFLRACLWSGAAVVELLGRSDWGVETWRSGRREEQSGVSGFYGVPWSRGGQSNVAYSNGNIGRRHPGVLWALFSLKNFAKFFRFLVITNL